MNIKKKKSGYNPLLSEAVFLFRTLSKPETAKLQQPMKAYINILQRL